MTLSLTVNETLKQLSSLPILMQKSYPLLPFTPSLISLMVSVDGKHHVYLLTLLLGLMVVLGVG